MLGLETHVLTSRTNGLGTRSGRQAPRQRAPCALPSEGEGAACARPSESGAAHPDVLQVLAVDRVDDAVGADELDGAVDADVYHGAALTVLGRRRHPGPSRHTVPATTGDLAQVTPGTLHQRWDAGLTVDRMCRTTSRGTTERSSSFSCRGKHERERMA